MFFTRGLQRTIARQQEEIDALRAENERRRGELADLQARLATAETDAFAARRCELFAGLFGQMQSFARSLVEFQATLSGLANGLQQEQESAARAAATTEAGREAMQRIVAGSRGAATSHGDLPRPRLPRAADADPVLRRALKESRRTVKRSSVGADGTENWR